MSDMSHFVVAVISRTPKEVKQLLAPYQENSEGKCPRQYLEFMDAEKIGRREYKNGNIRKIQAPDGQLLSMDDPMFQDTISGIIVPDGYKIVTVPFKDLYPTFENYMEVYHGYKERDHETGRYGTWLNPNGRWEEWCIGGQFHGFLKASKGILGELPEEYIMDENNPYLGVPNQCKQAQIKDIDFNPYLGVPNRYDQAQIKDIDFSVDQAAYDKAIRFWEVYVEKAPLKSGEDPTKFQSTFPPEFFTGLYKSKENYAEEQSTFSPWAFVTPDGKWIKKGVSYWWLYYTEDMKHLRAFSAALEKTLSECDPEWYITIIDCQSYFGV